ncbi:MAG: S8 family serine peptidase, partial [Clostridium sp.]
MARRKWEKSQLWRKIVSGTVSLSLILSLFPLGDVNAYEGDTRGSVNSIRRLAKKYQNDIKSAELELGINPIDAGVDITTEEYESIIVEFKSLPRITSNALNSGVQTYSIEGGVEKDHSDFNKFLSDNSKEKLATTYSIDHFYYNSFNGVSMKVKGTDISKLLDSGVVKYIWKDEEVRLDPEIMMEKMEEGPSTRMVTSTPLIQVDKLRAEGITGKGIKVGVIDTGIDYNHPDLKGNYKEGGYDFVDGDNDPMETTYEDWKQSGEAELNENGNSYYTYHGTHVSGTIGANGKNAESEFAVKGIAPEADIYGYRVLGPFGVGNSSDIIAAIEKSIDDGMDVINLSLGIQTPNPLYPTSIACNNAAIAGVVPVVANGNAGPNETTLGSPGSSSLAISVGASTTNIALDKFKVKTSTGVTANGKLLARTFKSIEDFTNNEYEVVYGGFGFENELLNVNAKGKILILDRGYLSFGAKFEAAKKAGAIGLIIANNVPGEMNLYFGEKTDIIPGISMSMEEGKMLIDAIKDVSVGSEAIKIKLALDGKTTTEADKLADFSSRGPALDETIKPDIVAPGVGIFSTYPEYINSPEDGIDYSTAYSRIDGTSMASPHIAGVAALMLQNNNNLTPEQVKVAMMNTAEDLVGDYAVNAEGAGRINAYNAVHSDIAIQVLDKCQSVNEFGEKIEIDYTTGSLSFDRIARREADTNKSKKLQVVNSGTTNKSFDVSVKFSGEEVGAKNANTNNVTLDIARTVKVEAGKTIDLDTIINIPANAELGRYEGYITVRNSENPTEDYRLPFAVKYLTPGMNAIELSRPAVSNDLEMMHYAKASGISATISVSSPISTMDVYVKDFETQEIVGYVGQQDLSELPPGYSLTVKALDGRASYFPVDKDGNTDYVRSALVDGKYILEFIAIDQENGDKYKYNYNVLVDNQDVQLKMDKTPGVYEITKDMFTTEEFYGQDYEAYWVHGNAMDNSIKELNDMGYKNINNSNILISGFTNGMPSVGLPVSENGDFKFGIEEMDIEYGVYEFSPMPTDIATSQNLYLPPRYFFVKEGAPYTSVTLDKDEMQEGEDITATIKVNNVTGSSFDAKLDYFYSFEINDIKINEELQHILDANKYRVNIQKEITGDVNRYLNLKLDVVDKDGIPVNISGDIALLDVEFNLASDEENEFYKEYIQCRQMKVKDKEGNYVEMAYNGTYEGVMIKQKTSSIRVPQMGQGFYDVLDTGRDTSELDKYIWVEDGEGNKYDLKYLERNQEYYLSNIPASTKELRVVSSMPGHFKKAGKFVPSRDFYGELLGKSYYMAGTEFYRSLLGGETNDDGVIDILDALEVEKYYGKKVDYTKNPVDFNFDGIVDVYDMDFIVYNFTGYNEQIADRKEPAMSFEGRDLDDILKAVGYEDTIRLDEITIDKTNMTLELGKTEKLTATLTPNNVPGISLIWSSENEQIATVDANGNVTAVAPGATTVIVKTNDGRLSLKCAINVTKDGEVPTITGITLEKPIMDVKIGEEFDLNFNLEPYNHLVKTAEFISSSNSIVSVVDGKAVAHKAGKVIVTVNINSYTVFGTWEINVTDTSTSLKSIALNEETLKLKKGESSQLEVTFDPADATNKNVTWSSSDEKIVKVVDGKVVAIGVGEAVVTVKSEDGGYTDTCKVTVLPTDIGLKSIKLNESKIKLKKGESSQLAVTFDPADATNKNVTWSSSDEKVATVVAGKVVAVGVGEAVVTVKSEDGGYTDTCKVTVLPTDIGLKSIKLNESKIKLKKGESSQLAVTFDPADATNKNVTWSSSDEKIVKVV